MRLIQPTEDALRATDAPQFQVTSVHSIAVPVLTAHHRQRP